MKDIWQIFKTMSEFVEGFEALDQLGPAITVFGSARTPQNHHLYADARKAGHLLAENGFAVITGGGPGIMAAANQGALDGGGTSVGLNIQLPNETINNGFQNISVNFHYFYARKVCFLKHCDGIICFPGGFGTMDEFFEIVTLIQTGKTDPMPVALVGTAYWNNLIEFLKKSMLDGDMEYIVPADLTLFTVTDSIEEAVATACGAKKNESDAPSAGGTSS